MPSDPSEEVSYQFAVERARTSEIAHLINSELQNIATNATADLTGFAFDIQQGIFDIEYDWEPGPTEEFDLINRVAFSVMVGVSAA